MFDDIARDDFTPYQHNESLWTFLNRSAAPAAMQVRAFMDDLLNDYPKPGKAELVARLRSNEFEGVYFELLLHALLLRHGAEVHIHSSDVSANAKRPDFLATFPSGQSAIFEAVVSKDISASKEAEETAWSELYQQIDELPSEFFIGIGIPFTTMPDRPPAPRKVLSFLKRKLDKLDPRAEPDRRGANSARDNRSFPICRFKDGDITIEFTFIPKGESWRGSSGSIGVYPSKSRCGGSSKSIKKTVEDKASKYGDVKLPYVVVVNSLSPWMIGTADEREALFGSPQVRYGGAFLRSNGAPHNIQVSAVAIGRVLWRPGIARLRLYEHPHAQKSARAIPWRLDRMNYDQPMHELKKGESIGEILNLPEEWPGDFVA